MSNGRRLIVGGVGMIVLVLLAGVAFAGPLDAPGATKALACSACHGPGGQSPGETMPILAGMPAWYFKKAIADYASAKRPSPEMEPFAKQAVQLGVDDIAAFFASQKREPSRIKVDAAAVERGRARSAECVICHGADGKGDPAKGVPDLRGQPPGYLQNQMLLFKADRRSPGDDRLKALKAVMKTTPDDAFTDLAAYYSSLR
ncbi:MAG: c-type cytochrome [Candidatus Rokubacteria bacterium]|nr:c-type cytochrome [Candidatus Rokubacteria bacterium]